KHTKAENFNTEATNELTQNLLEVLKKQNEQLTKHINEDKISNIISSLPSNK
ncbi:25791_t:CDS:1, partial [Gigaspora margarita]